MAGTHSSLSGGSGGLALPAPVVRVASNRAGTPYSVSDGAPTGGAVAAVTARSVATVSVHGLPQAVLDDISRYAPKLELLRYTRVRSRRTSARSAANAGYVHPSHGPAASGNGSHTHGGQHTHVAGVVQAIRPTEWDVTNWGQVIDVTQGLHGFMQLHRIAYRQPATGPAVINSTSALIPSGAAKTGRQFGRRFPYSARFSPGYYKFRWSIIDPSDDRGQRITGPLSDTVSITNDVFPFLPAEPWIDASTGTVHSAAALDPRFDPFVSRIWVGSVSRLPR